MVNQMDNKDTKEHVGAEMHDIGATQKNEQFTADEQSKRNAEINAIRTLKSANASWECKATNPDMLWLVRDNLRVLDGKKVHGCGYKIVRIFPSEARDGCMTYHAIARDGENWVCGKYIAWDEEGHVYWSNGEYTQSRECAEEFISDWVTAVF